MSDPVLTAEELMQWVDRTAVGWRDLVAEHSEILDLPCDIMNVSTAGGLLQHIVAVQLRFAERLAGLAPSEYSAIPFDSAEALYATHERSLALLREQLAAHVDWDERLEFMTRSQGRIRASRRAFLLQPLLHAVRHYAQLATLVRQHGIEPGWPMDYLFMDAERVTAT